MLKLKNIIERLVVLNGGSTVAAADLPPRFKACIGQINPSGIKITGDGICLNSACSNGTVRNTTTRP